MEVGDKTSLVRCFRLQKLSYDDLISFCRWRNCDPPSRKNWDMEWRRVEKAADVLRAADGTADQALEAALFPTEDSLAGERAERILAAAQVLAGKQPIAEHYDVVKWALELSAWSDRV
jgi:hypothetical protein